MSTNQYGTENTEGVNFGLTYTISSVSAPEYPAPPFTVGTLKEGSDQSAWVFVQASSAVAVGQVCYLSTSWVANPVTTALATFGTPLAVAPLVAFSAADFGWMQRLGKCNAINMVLSSSPNVQLATTSTAGRLATSTATGTLNVTGIVLTATAPSVSASSSVTNSAYLNWPVVGTTN